MTKEQNAAPQEYRQMADRAMNGLDPVAGAAPTPRVDKLERAIGQWMVVYSGDARDLERENAALREQLAAWKKYCWIAEDEANSMRQQLATSESRIELLEHDMKSGDYESLYAQAVAELADAQSDLRVAEKQVDKLVEHFGFANIDDALNSENGGSAEARRKALEELPLVTKLSTYVEELSKRVDAQREWEAHPKYEPGDGSAFMEPLLNELRALIDQPAKGDDARDALRYRHLRNTFASKEAAKLFAEPSPILIDAAIDTAMAKGG